MLIKSLYKFIYVFTLVLAFWHFMELKSRLNLPKQMNATRKKNTGIESDGFDILKAFILKRRLMWKSNNLLELLLYI